MAINRQIRLRSRPVGMPQPWRKWENINSPSATTFVTAI